jgi:hypothetical protein
MSDPKKEQSGADVVNRCLHEIAEHFESVQILATRVEGEQTMRCFRGSGNYYARLGMAREFVTEDQAQEQAKQIADKLNPEDED